MATTKDRKLFAFNNFRGLDKENKPLKVASFRASDGYNFIIDSDTLKTRPAVVKYNTLISPYLLPNEVVVDWYNYGNFVVYITDKHFRIILGVNQYKEDNAKFVTSGLPSTIDWSNKKPIFKEEKEALFIFGLDKVYVFSAYTTNGDLDKSFLYDIAAKPNNPYDPELAKTQFDFFENLPYAYVPTIFIGDNAFEDLNNLSNSYKYNLFAEANAFTADGYNTYYLPTHYEESKHGLYTYDIEFYNGKFGDFEALPFYLGVNNEDITYEESVYGETLNTNPISIIDTFFPAQDFEYFTDLGETPTISVIKQIFGLDKKTFFGYRVAGDNRTTFEYILEYLKTNTIDWNESNRVLSFTLPIEYNAIYKSITDNTTVEVAREKANIIVYVQLRRFETEGVQVVNNGITTESIVTTNASEYPSLINNLTEDTNIDIDNLTYGETNTGAISLTNVSTTNFTSSYAQSIARSWLLEQSLSGGTITEPNTARVSVRLERIETNTTPTQVNNYPANVYVCTSIVDYFIQSDSYSTTFPNSLPEASWRVPNDAPIIQLSPISVYSGILNFTSSNLLNDIRNQIFSRFDQLPQTFTQGFVYYKVPISFVDYSRTYQPYIYSQVTAVYKYYVTKGTTTTTYYRLDGVYNANYFNNDGTLTIDGLYDLQLSPDNANAFELKIKDYFFDYSQEPSIEVTIKHQFNPDYNLIANSTFGISFGSENRFFLAGNPDYPNIDRYNVSNDLLSVNEANQSYELSYFPSKNYRVVGGKGAINGYVIATDSQLYVTKVDYPNDDKLFIRERILNENGVVGYREFKTNISKTPINERCIVRFYNDILILSKDGLYAIEISSNVLTNERLLKLRSGFINKDLKASLLSAVEAPFILENNYYMYIIIDKTIYVADSRYVAVNENGMIDNQSYEIVKWNFDTLFKKGKITETDIYLLDETYGAIYTLRENDNEDQRLIPLDDANHTTVNLQSTTTEYAHTFTSELNDLFYANPESYSFTFSGGYRWIETRTPTGFSYANNTVTVINDDAFADITDGDILAVYDFGNSQYFEFVVSGFEASGRQTFTIPVAYTETPAEILAPLRFGSHYIVQKYIYNGAKYFVLNFYEPDSVADLGTLNDPLPSPTYTRNKMYESVVNFYSKDTPIQFLWASNVTDFGNNLMEKTMFRLNVYATKQVDANFVNVGYKTMRRLKQADDSSSVRVTDQIDLSNPNNFDEVNFLFYAINTFNEMGTSIPAKENNFLYIQFLVTGEGAIELNAIEIIYKNNRMLKSIG